MRIAQVIVDVGAAETDRVFDYRLTEAQTNICPGYRVKVPFGPRTVEGFVVNITENSQVPSSRLRDVLAPLENYPALLEELISLSGWMKEKYHCLLVDALRVMLPAQMRGSRVHEKTEQVISLSRSMEETGKAILQLSRAPRQAEALNALLYFGGTAEAGMLREHTPVDASVWQALQKKGLVEIGSRELLRRPLSVQNIAPDAPREPDMYQRRAIAQITGAMGKGGAFLLHGVTGCGKTEVYMQAAQQALAQGKGVIILVPEISLTPQMTERFVARFGDKAAVLHSRLSPGERFDEWRRIRLGAARVVVGARSAIFAPMENIGLIVIDEEHEQSYFSEHNPRYHAAEIARWRAEKAGAPLVLGSATPSVTSYYAARQGEYTLIEMPRRILGRPLPEVTVADMRKELVSGNKSVLSRQLREELTQCLARHEQAILLLNRRGHSTFVSCRSCGEPIKCDLCDVAMTWHKSIDKLKCHYCGETKPLPAQCPACGSKYIRYFGDGTQKLEEELARLFPAARLLRMDADTTRGKNSHMVLLDRFRRGEADILIGTQMIAKGLDFPNVTLVGIVAVDVMLFMPDYRSTERAYQLMAQVAGRAGRAEKEGRVILQTYSPDHIAVRCAAAHNYSAFFSAELEDRLHSQYPPFGHMLRVVITHEDKNSARLDTQTLRRQLDAYLEAHAELKEAVLFVETMPAPITRIQARYRYQLVLKLKNGPQADVIQGWLTEHPALPAASYISIELDPQAML